MCSVGENPHEEFNRRGSHWEGNDYLLSSQSEPFQQPEPGTGLSWKLDNSGTEH